MMLQSSVAGWRSLLHVLVVCSGLISTGVLSAHACPVATRNVPDGPDPWGGCFPGPQTSGVPAGTALTRYTDSCTIRADGTIIDGKIIDCVIQNYARNVIIKNSQIAGAIVTASTDASITILNNTIDGRDNATGGIDHDNAIVAGNNIFNGKDGINCNYHCTAKDNYIHDQFDGTAVGWHQQGFHAWVDSANDLNLHHNSVVCTTGGCTADITLNSETMFNAFVDRNLLMASPTSSFCAYPAGGKRVSTQNVTWLNNIFQRGANRKCGFYGAVYSWDRNPSHQNTWSGNLWDDFTTLNSDGSTGARLPASARHDGPEVQ
jgi:hypothetical protein